MGASRRLYYRVKRKDSCLLVLTFAHSRAFFYQTLKIIPHICASWTAQGSKGRAPASPASRFCRLGSGQEQPSRPHDLRSNLACSRENSPGYRSLKSPRPEIPSTTSDVDFPSLNPPVGHRESASRERWGASHNDGVDSSSSERIQKSTTMSSLDSVQTLISDSNDESPGIYSKDLSKSSKNEGWSKPPGREIDSSKREPCCDTR